MTTDNAARALEDFTASSATSWKSKQTPEIGPRCDPDRATRPPVDLCVANASGDTDHRPGASSSRPRPSMLGITGLWGLEWAHHLLKALPRPLRRRACCHRPRLRQKRLATIPSNEWLTRTPARPGTAKGGLRVCASSKLPVYDFTELSDRAKDKARTWFRRKRSTMTGGTRHRRRYNQICWILGVTARNNHKPEFSMIWTATGEVNPTGRRDLPGGLRPF